MRAVLFVLLAACWSSKSSPSKSTGTEPISNTVPVDARVAVDAAEDDENLRVTGMDPDRGDVNGGTYLVIKGSRFLEDGPRSVKVYFGSRQGTVIRFQSDTELIVQAPGGKPNEVVDVLLVFDPGGQIKLPNAFTFVDKQP